MNVTFKGNSWFVTDSNGNTKRRSTLMNATKLIMDKDVTVHGIPVPKSSNLVEMYDRMCKIAYKFVK